MNLKKIIKQLTPPLLITLLDKSGLKYLLTNGQSRPKGRDLYLTLPDIRSLSNNAKIQATNYVAFIDLIQSLKDSNYFYYFLQKQFNYEKEIKSLLLKFTRDRDLELKNLRSAIPDEAHIDSWFDVLSKNSFDDETLSKFYNSKRVVGFTFARLNNPGWLTARLLPLLLVDGLHSKNYVEDGGADGLLPIFASYLCKSSMSIELNSHQLKFSEELARLAKVPNFKASNSFESLSDSSLDIVSSHQVLEHVANPIDHIGVYYKKLKPGGVIIASTGFGIHPFPGHLPSSMKYAGREKELFEKAGFIEHKFNDIVYAFLGDVIYVKP